jgi:hypothetical protein
MNNLENNYVYDIIYCIKLKFNNNKATKINIKKSKSKIILNTLSKFKRYYTLFKII